MRHILLTLAAIGLLGFSTALAHDADPIAIDLGLGDTYYMGHDDDDPWKGTATVTVTNSGTEPWRTFYFQIFDPMWQGNYTDVVFTTGDGSYPRLNGVTVDPADFEITTTLDGYSRLGIGFTETPVYPGQSVQFIVYTDNTAGQHSFFGMMIWPSDVVAAESQTLSAVKDLFR